MTQWYIYRVNNAYQLGESQNVYDIIFINDHILNSTSNVALTERSNFQSDE